MTLRPYAIASLLVYTLGIPLAFGAILYVHRKEIEADQKLREAGEGNTPDSNPHYFIRTRYQELYVLFRPGTVFRGIRVQQFVLQRCCGTGVTVESVSMSRHGTLASSADATKVLHRGCRPYVQLQPTVPGLVRGATTVMPQGARRI